MTYDPSLGRFLQLDPIGLDGGTFNEYEFVGDNPVDRTDPSGTRIAATGNAWGRTEYVWVPDSFTGDIKEYVNKQYPLPSNLGHERYYPYQVNTSSAQQALIDAAKGDETAEKELILLLNFASKTSVFPALPVLGSKWGWPETFGSHCVRWTAALNEKLAGLPATKFGKKIAYKDFILRYPRPGGPTHSITLVKVKGSSVVIGVDNGFLGKTGLPDANEKPHHFFDPNQIIKDTSYPAEMREDLDNDLKEFRGK